MVYYTFDKESAIAFAVVFTLIVGIIPLLIQYLWLYKQGNILGYWYRYDFEDFKYVMLGKLDEMLKEAQKDD